MISAITKTFLANHVFKILQQHPFINTSITPDGGHTANHIRQNDVSVVTEHLKIEKPFIENSSEMDNFPCINNTEHSPDTKVTVMGDKFSY